MHIDFYVFCVILQEAMEYRQEHKFPSSTFWRGNVSSEIVETSRGKLII